MLSKNIGLIIYTKKLKDNDLFVKVLSDEDEIIFGVVYGGNSSKKRSVYQIGYFIEYNISQRGINSIKSVSGDISNPYIANIYIDKYKSFSMLAIISILNINSYEGIKIAGLYLSVKKLVSKIQDENHWIIYFCQWLMKYLQLLGYEIEYVNKRNNKYFNLNTLNFQDIANSKSIIFPHDIFTNNVNLRYESVKSLFIIFETVFKKNILDNLNNKMPESYINFTNAVLNRLKKR